MKKAKFKSLTIVLFSLFAFLLVGCDDTASQNFNDEVHSFKEVGTSDILDAEDTDLYDPLRDDEFYDFDEDEFISVALQRTFWGIAYSLETIPYIILNYEDGTVSSTKDISMDILFHIDDESLYFEPDDVDSSTVSLYIEWLDLIASGNLYDPIADLLNEDFNEIDKEMSLDLSTYFTTELISEPINNSGINCIDLSLNVDQDDSSDMTLSGHLDYSFAARIINTENSALGAFSANLSIDEIDSFNGADYEYVGIQIENLISDILSSEGDSLESQIDASDYVDVWEDIENNIWGNTSNDHISVEFVLADAEGVINSATLVDEDLFKQYLIYYILITI